MCSRRAGSVTDAGALVLDGNIGSMAMTARLSRAPLLTVRGFGHTELLNPSACASRYITAYLLWQTQPPAHTICRQDQLPLANHTRVPASQAISAGEGPGAG
jgi:hypothetical protein